MRALAHVRPAAPVLRHQRRQHGLDDQPLHRQPQSPQRRRLLSRRSHRPAAPTVPPWPTASAPAKPTPACRSSPAVSKPACAAWPTTTTGPTQSAAPFCSTPRRPPRLRHGRAPDRRNRPPPRRRRDGQRPPQPARRRLSPRRQRIRRIPQSLHPLVIPHPIRRSLPNRYSTNPSPASISTLRKNSAPSPKSSHQETNPLQRPTPGAISRPPKPSSSTPPPLPLTQAEMDRDLRPALHAPAASELRQRKNPRLRRGQGFGAQSCAAASAAAPSARITAHEGRIIQVAVAGIGPRRNRADADNAARLHRRRLRHRRPDRQHVPDALHAAPRSKPSAAASVCVHPTICKLLGTDHGPLDRPDDKSLASCPASKKSSSPPASAWTWPAAIPIHARARRASRRRPSQGRPRAYRSGRARPDEEARERRFREFRPAVHEAVESRAGKKQYLIPYYIASHPGSDLNAMIDLALFLKRNDYRPDQVQDFIPSPVRHRRLHVPHRHRSVHHAAGLHRQAPPRPPPATRPAAILQA